MVDQYKGKHKQDYRTPKWLRDHLIGTYNINFDGAADANNALVSDYYDSLDDALNRPWPTGISACIFCNPPYARANGGIGAWLARGYEAVQGGAECAVFLLPANTGTRWFAKYAPLCSEVIFMHPRVAFEDDDGNVHGSPAHASMLMVFENKNICKRVAHEPAEFYVNATVWNWKQT